MDYKKMRDMDVFDFIAWLDNAVDTKLPKEIVTMEDMKSAGEMLLKFSSEYSYMASLYSWFKAATRYAKRNESREVYEDMVDKKEAVENKLDAVKQLYAGVSRAVTIRQENNIELRMTSSQYVA